MVKASEEPRKSPGRAPEEPWKSPQRVQKEPWKSPGRSVEKKTETTVEWLKFQKSHVQSVL